MKKVLLAGATGYLGSYLAKTLHERDYGTRAIARNPISLVAKKLRFNEILEAELTNPNAIEDCCNNIDIVISTVGITRQKDGLIYMEKLKYVIYNLRAMELGCTSYTGEEISGLFLNRVTCSTPRLSIGPK